MLASYGAGREATPKAPACAAWRSRHSGDLQAVFGHPVGPRPSPTAVPPAKSPRREDLRARCRAIQAPAGDKRACLQPSPGSPRSASRLLIQIITLTPPHRATTGALRRRLKGHPRRTACAQPPAEFAPAARHCGRIRARAEAEPELACTHDSFWPRCQTEAGSPQSVAADKDRIFRCRLCCGPS